MVVIPMAICARATAGAGRSVLAVNPENEDSKQDDRSLLVWQLSAPTVKVHAKLLWQGQRRTHRRSCCFMHSACMT